MAECSSAPPVPPQPTTVFRVRRKRTADPHDALIVSLKRARPASAIACCAPFAPLIYQLATTSPFPEVTRIGSLPPSTQLNIIDYDPSKGKHLEESLEQQPAMESESVEDSPLCSLSGAVGELGGQQAAAAGPPDQFTLNGVPLHSVDTSLNSEDYVFDFYWNARGMEYPPDVIEIRTAKPEELELYVGEDTESSAANDDDDDSNDENNWRNDYPDEQGSKSDAEDSDAESVDEPANAYEELHRRLDEWDFNESDDEAV